MCTLLLSSALKFLLHMQATFAARAVRSGNLDIRDLLKGNRHPLHHHNDRRLPWAPRDAVCPAFFLSGAPTEGTLSNRDFTDHRTATLRDLTIFDPEQEDSKKDALLTPHLEALREKGWRIAYTDSSGAKGTHAVGVFSEGSRPRTYGGYVGPTASVADAERLGLALALEKEHP